MHPDQYRMGYRVLSELAAFPAVQSALEQWPCIFNAITFVSNRCSPLHRDSKGSFPLFDILASTGEYTHAPWVFQPLGLQIPNNPGSMCGVSGKAFRHGVAPADGRRECHAFYMRKELQEFVSVRPCSWMCQDVYGPWIGSGTNGTKVLANIDDFCI